ncbi:MAG: hypothetical protein FJ146_15810 [Deltaproteobacteria bacterium]|nr:hypothetical protein [Deltaproteobacteria bacterium]
MTNSASVSGPNVVSPYFPWFARTVGLAIIAAIFQVMFTFAATNRDFSYFNYWQYFTNQSNLISALVILYRWSPLYRGDELSRARYESWRAALVVFMSQTTFVYWALLHGLFKSPDALTALSNAFLHSGAFVYFLLEYAVEPPETLISLSSALWWLAYPVAYTALIQVMAQFRAWYPYPFMDPAKSGSVGAAVINQLVLALIIVAVALTQRWLHNKWWSRRHGEQV